MAEWFGVSMEREDQDLDAYTANFQEEVEALYCCQLSRCLIYFMDLISLTYNCFTTGEEICSETWGETRRREKGLRLNRANRRNKKKVLGKGGFGRRSDFPLFVSRRVLWRPPSRRNEDHLSRRHIGEG